MTIRPRNAQKLVSLCSPARRSSEPTLAVAMAFTKFRVELASTDPGSLKSIQKKAYVSTSTKELIDHPSLGYLTNYPARCPSTNTSKSTIVNADEHPLARYLETLGQTILHILCVDQDFTNPLVLKHMSPTFSAREEGIVSSTCREEHFIVCAQAMDAMPGYEWDIIESVFEIFESGKKAKQWTFKRLKGLYGPHQRHMFDGPGICKESVSVMSWELQEETWVCTRLKKMNGVSGVA